MGLVALMAEPGHFREWTGITTGKLALHVEKALILKTAQNRAAEPGQFLPVKDGPLVFAVTGGPSPGGVSPRDSGVGACSLHLALPGWGQPWVPVDAVCLPVTTVPPCHPRPVWFLECSTASWVSTTHTAACGAKADSLAPGRPQGGPREGQMSCVSSDTGSQT